MSGIQIESIETYMKQIAGYKRLTAARELELAALKDSPEASPEARAAAKEELVQANLRLVVKVAHDFKLCGMHFPDLVGEGNLGLLAAAEKFDPSRGVRFGCYASMWIRQAIRTALSEKSRTIRIPTQGVGKLRKLEKAQQEFLQTHHRLPDTEELAVTSGLAASTIEILKHAITKVYSLDDTLRDGDTTTFEDVLGAEADSSTDTQNLEHADDILYKNLHKLSDRSRMILELRFGMRGEPCHMQLIAQAIGCTQRVTEQYYTEALRELRSLIKADGITHAHTA